MDKWTPLKWSAPTFWWGITGSGDWIGGAVVEMAIGRLDLEKPATRPSEDICTWPKAPGGDRELGSGVTGPKCTSAHALGPLRVALGLTR